MSEEDIEFINGIRDYLKEEKEKCGRNTIFTFEYQRIIEVIDKLQKENKELKEDNKKLNDLLMLGELDYISKDIIRDKIKEIAEEPQIYVDTEKFDIEFEKSNYTIDVLKELLGDSNE